MWVAEKLISENFQFQLTTQQIDHCDECIDVPISPGTISGRLYDAVDAFKNAVGQLRIEVIQYPCPVVKSSICGDAELSIE